jgi:hypothetical protein
MVSKTFDKTSFDVRHRTGEALTMKSRNNVKQLREVKCWARQNLRKIAGVSPLTTDRIEITALDWRHLAREKKTNSIQRMKALGNNFRQTLVWIAIVIRLPAVALAASAKKGPQVRPVDDNLTETFAQYRKAQVLAVDYDLSFVLEKGWDDFKAKPRSTWSSRARIFP